MSNGNSIINFGDVSKPATVLIEKISDAIGGYFKPYQIRQVALAEADSEKIKARTQIEIAELQQRALDELQQRALHRFIFEEAKKQDNIESITAKALPYLKEDANPDSIENDWIANFFDKCRLISDEQMQALWAKLLAGEANFPGNYSKRTIDLLSSLDKTDAILFSTLCGFVWYSSNVFPLIHDVKASIYMKYGINFSVLEHLDDIGLVNFNAIGEYTWPEVPNPFCMFYHGTPVNIEFPREQNNKLILGKVLLTRVGRELAPICDSEPLPDFFDYILTLWRDQGLVVSSPYPRNLPVNENK